MLLALGLVAASCSFPEHDFIPADEFAKLKDGGQQGGGGAGGAGGFGGVGATGGVAGTDGGGGVTGGGGSGGKGGSGGASGGSGGASGGSGGASGGSGGASGGSGGSGGATGGSGGATGGSGGSGGTACATLVINEVSTEGPTLAGDEFVELYNAGTCTAALSGWAVKYSSASGASASNVWVGGAADSIAAGAYFVIGGDSFTGSKNGSLSGGLAAAGGGVALFEGATKKDSVAWGTAASTHPYIEGTAVGTIPKNQSAARKPDGKDTNVNSTDFVIGARTPGATNGT